MATKKLSSTEKQIIKIKKKLKNYKGWHTRNETLFFLGYDENLMKFCLKHKLIRAVHQYSHTFRYYKNYRDK
ncbi:MAG: hypothetical protein HGGPFJEG_01452 [Ignavibacteria bacterium]|nr:hypothetical protein [Ignavibacteria bacterium]